jgi:hypothetical protein
MYRCFSWVLGGVETYIRILLYLKTRSVLGGLVSQRPFLSIFRPFPLKPSFHDLSSQLAEALKILT